MNTNIWEYEITTITGEIIKDIKPCNNIIEIRDYIYKKYDNIQTIDVWKHGNKKIIYKFGYKENDKK